MKTELWSKVKVGDYLIYADEDDGVQKVKVTEVDITIETFEPEYKKEQPYGLTAETGYVKIKWNTNEIVENLANLIRFNDTYYRLLQSDYLRWQQYKAQANEYKQDFIARRTTLRMK